MNMYVGMAATVLILAYLIRQDKPENRKPYIWVSCLLMFIVMGLRDVYSIGMDSATSYVRIFHEIGALNWSGISEYGGGSNLGFSYLVKFFYDLTGGDYQLFYTCYAALILSNYARFISKYSISPAQSFAYFWGLLDYLFLYDAIKQGIAMAFILLAFDAIVEKKPLQFLLLVLAAYFIHEPALIFLPAYAIAAMHVGGAYLILLALMLVFTYQYRADILELMLTFYGTELQMHDMAFLGNKVLIMIVIVVAAIVLRPPEKEDRVYSVLLQFMGIAIVIQTFASYNNTFERLANYYFQFSVVFIPMVFQLDQRHSRLLNAKTEAMAKQIAPWLFGGFGVWRFANYVTNNAWLYLPYRFFFK